MQRWDRHHQLLGWLLAATLLSVCGAARSERLHHYTVLVNAELTQLEVKACFDGAPPEQLVAQSLDATVALEGVWHDATDETIAPIGTIPLKTVSANECIRYRVDVSRPIKRHDRTGGKVERVGNDVAVSVGLWLWRPEKLADDEDVELAFDLPAGVSVSTPWQPVPGSDRPAYRLGHTPSDWPAWIALGHFRQTTRNVAGAQLDIAILDGSPAVDEKQIGDWIVDAATMVASVDGRFPYSRVQVMVMPNARAREPTPWAFVTRGGGPAVHFIINQRRPIEEFYRDWTATHEFSHLLLPFVKPAYAWMSEGLATYYQNVLRARAGRLTAQQAWSELDAGFARGRKEATDLTLAEATGRMYRNGLFMKVYWSGTAMMLMADLHLRQISKGTQSLDTALAALGECCLDSPREWDGPELFSKLDALTGSTVFTSLLNEYADSARFPDLSATYHELGLMPAVDGVSLVADAPFAGVRDAIMHADVTPMTHALSEQ